jgi:hypothetical protein
MRWLTLIVCGLLGAAACSHSTLAGALNDREFWSLIETLSEPPGTFALSDNFVSNEPHVAESVRRLRPRGGVYVGVGPEQNFSYIARLRPAMAFIVDIRRENRNLHLLYKALFELSGDRADFVSRLFSRARPPGVGAGTSVDALFAAYERVPATRELFSQTAALVRERLVTMHGLPLSQDDLAGLERVLDAFYADGPQIQFWGSRGGHGDGAAPSYRRLMTITDFTGQARSFLATDDGFRFVKDLQARNMIVPVVGDFGGADALRRVGDYVREHRDVIHAFYGSNVGVYLTLQKARVFCGTLARLPAAPHAWFIESDDVRSYTAKLAVCPRDTK